MKHFFFPQNDLKRQRVRTACSYLVRLLAHRYMTFSVETLFGTEHNFDFDKLVFIALSLMWL